MFYICSIVHIRQLVAHRQSVVKEHGLDEGREGTPSDSSGDDMSQPRRKAPPPPSGTSRVEPLDLAGVQKREKTHTASSQGRPKSDVFAVRPAPPPPKRHESLESTAQLTKSSSSDKNSGNNSSGDIEKEKPTMKRSDSANDDNMSVSSDGSVGAGGISPNTKRRINTYLNTAGTGLESVKEDTKLELPTEFPTELGLELVDIVRERYVCLFADEWAWLEVLHMSWEIGYVYRNYFWCTLIKMSFMISVVL